MKAAAARRLAVQRAFYDEGHITLDRWLDAIDKDAQAIAAEARHQAGYNTSLAALSEARGTLLADRDITIAEGPKRVGPIVGKTTEPISIGWQPPKRGEIIKPGGVSPGTTAAALFHSRQFAGNFSPPAMVDKASKILGSTEPSNQRIEPSAIATFVPDR